MFESVDKKRFRGERIGVIYGGESAERPVSLKTGEALAEALRAGEYEVVEYDLPQDLADLTSNPPEAAVLALHGGVGENGTIQGCLEMLEVPYTGSGVLGSALALDKVRSKSLFRDAGMMTPEFGSIGPDEAVEVADDLEPWLRRRQLEPPLVVKPSDGGSSQGVRMCDTTSEVAQAVDGRAGEMDETPSSGILVEEYIDGREFTVGLFGGEPLGALQVIPGEEFYDYEAKYESEETRYEIVEEPSLLQRLEAAGRMAARTLGCRGVSRVDFVAGTERGDQILYVLEVNTIPGMTETSLVPKLAKHQGISFESFAEWMLSNASLHTQQESSS